MADVEKVKNGIKNCTDKKNKNPCESCEYRRKQGCTSYWMKDALSVIEELQAENERLCKKIGVMKESIEDAIMSETVFDTFDDLSRLAKMADRYFTHIVGCLEASIKAAEDGVDCHVPVVTVQGAVDLLKEQDERIEKLTPKDGMNLKELWEKARSGETLSENEWKFITADWDRRNGYNQPKEGDKNIKKHRCGGCGLILTEEWDYCPGCGMHIDWT